MNQLLHQINLLSKRDTKTLSQKALKAAEEVGELAAEVLPYEGAEGTNHRLPNSDAIAEECADVILVAYSILKAMDRTDAEIIDVIQKKTDYWQFLTDNERYADINNLEFEIHITVSQVDDIEKFKRDCNTIGIKPIILDLYTPDMVIKDVMTSSHYRGDTKSVVEYSKALVKYFKNLGYRVVREKIESAPWHPAAIAHKQGKSAYFEAHFEFCDLNKKNLVEAFAKNHNIHLSRNVMKKGDRQAIMGTYRVDASQVSVEEFKAKVADIFACVVPMGVRKQPVVEYSLFDSNKAHDKEWVNA